MVGVRQLGDALAAVHSRRHEATRLHHRIAEERALSPTNMICLDRHQRRHRRRRRPCRGDGPCRAADSLERFLNLGRFGMTRSGRGVVTFPGFAFAYSMIALTVFEQSGGWRQSAGTSTTCVMRDDSLCVGRPAARNTEGDVDPRRPADVAR